MKKILIILTSLTISVAFLTTTAFATPNFASNTGKSCSYCHSSVPSLNATGQAFKANGFKLDVVKPTITEAPKTKVVTKIKVKLKLAIKNKAAGNIGVAPFVYDGLTYIPLRVMVAGMGDSLSWNSKNLVATVAKKNGKKVSFPAGKAVIIYNGKQVAIAGMPLTKDGVTYVPYRAVIKYLYHIQTQNGTEVITYNVEKEFESEQEDEIENEVENEVEDKAKIENENENKVEDQDKLENENQNHNENEVENEN